LNIEGFYAMMFDVVTVVLLKM